jgi:hypothetical protein
MKQIKRLMYCGNIFILFFILLEGLSGCSGTQITVDLAPDKAEEMIKAIK